MRHDGSVALNIIFIHGVYSDASAFEDLQNKFKTQTFLKYNRIQFSVIKYGKLLLTLERIPFVRNIITEYIAYRIALLNVLYPNAKTIVFAHSFGTWVVARALQQYYPLLITVDSLILLGSVIERNFNWADLPNTEVHNFIGKKDKVVFLGSLWGTGVSGRYGFKMLPCNVKQYETEWSHTDYPEGFSKYCEIIKDFYERKVRV